MTEKLNMRTAALVSLCLVFAIAGGLVTIHRSDESVSLDSALEIWADLARDIDRFGLTVTRISTVREMEIGREVAREVEGGHGYRQVVVDEYLGSVGDAVAKAVQRRGISYSFKVLESTEINAYAVPGGHVYVTTGMLNFLQSEAELAALLGHEISHVDLKHCIERLQYELIARRVIGDDLAAIVSIGYGLVRLGFSEQQELEADVAGMILAAEAGYDPRAAIALHERFAKLGLDRTEQEKKPTLMVQEVGAALGKALQQYFATHPPAELRIRQLEQAAKRNARAWQGRPFYTGRTNYRDRIPRGSDKREDEWRTYGRL